MKLSEIVKIAEENIKTNRAFKNVLTNKVIWIDTGVIYDVNSNVVILNYENINNEWEEIFN